MALETVLSGSAGDFLNLSRDKESRNRVEAAYAEGDRGEFHARFRGYSISLIRPTLWGIDASLRAAGVELTRPSTIEEDTLKVRFRKGAAIVGAIVIAILAAAVVAVLMIAFAFLRVAWVAPEAIPDMMKWAAVGALAIAAAVVVPRVLPKRS